MPGPDRKRRLTTLAIALVVLIATPLAVVASHQFDDVPDSNIFHDDIDWLADNGITLGCNPPDNDEFCPSDNVTRQQMAAFMHRLADNEVVNAATANEADHAATADSASTSDDANSVDGFDSSDLIRAGGVHVTTDLDNWDGSPVSDTDTIVAPEQGILIISYAVNLAEDADNATAGDSLYNIDPQVDGVTVGDIAWTSLDFDAGFTQTYNTWTVQRLVPVSAGSHQVSVELSRTSVGGLTYVFERSLTVLYVPFGSTGSLGVLSEPSDSGAGAGGPEGQG